MKRPTDEDIDTYCRRFNLTPDVAWRDYLQLESGDRAVTFAPIEWRDPAFGIVSTSIDLSMREELVLPAHRTIVDLGLVPAFEVLHIDLNEQAAEKMRCLAERSKVGDGWDVEALEMARKLSRNPPISRRSNVERWRWADGTHGTVM